MTAPVDADVVELERQSLAAQDPLAQAQVSQAFALVDVYRALGGGWEFNSVVAAR